jgi:hypothetical protein
LRKTVAIVHETNKKRRKRLFVTSGSPASSAESA